jgi:hypothetical protein
MLTERHTQECFGAYGQALTIDTSNATWKKRLGSPVGGAGIGRYLFKSLFFNENERTKKTLYPHQTESDVL